MAQLVRANDGGPPVRVVSLQELEQHARDVVRAVQETGTAVDIQDHGVVVAHVVPAGTPRDDSADLRRFWADLDEVAAELQGCWPKGVSAEDAVNDVRREL